MLLEFTYFQILFTVPGLLIKKQSFVFYREPKCTISAKLTGGSMKMAPPP